MKELNKKSSPADAYPIKVLQFGDGNFLRGFADWMIDILNEKASFHGSVVTVAPLRRGRPAVTDDQEGRYHVVLRGLSNGKRVDDVRLITCLDQYVDPYSEYEKLISITDVPSLQLIISNTTEAGITFHPGDIDKDSPPDSFPAKVTQLLYRRFNTYKGDVSKGLTFLPCELIENNGDVLRSIVLQYAKHWGLPSGFAEWVNKACTFSNTLVDRIVTGYPGDYAQQIMERTGYKDERIVAAEPYHLWVIQANASMNNVFPVDGVGLNVKFVSDLTPYRTSKVRVLNGAHTAMTLVGYLRGLRTVREAVEDRWMSEFLDKLVADEILPTIPLPQSEVKEYATAVFERFHNPEIKHELKSIALNSVSKFRARLLPTLLDRYKVTQQLPKRLVHVFAALIVFYRGQWKGESLPVSDSAETLEAFKVCWQDQSRPDVRRLLANEAIWGLDLTTIKGLPEELERCVRDILDS
ncbi:tagaturonate reductase [Chryseolinea sp. T2]|uniref:tagaturonate reductase n=1 Tax=Chryseolinea sp. T2 TaxID=3129255 RepID=UPI00307705BC